MALNATGNGSLFFGFGNWWAVNFWRRREFWVEKLVVLWSIWLGRRKVNMWFSGVKGRE